MSPLKAKSFLCIIAEEEIRDLKHMEVESTAACLKMEGSTWERPESNFQLLTVIPNL